MDLIVAKNLFEARTMAAGELRYWRQAIDRGTASLLLAMANICSAADNLHSGTLLLPTTVVSNIFKVTSLLTNHTPLYSVACWEGGGGLELGGRLQRRIKQSITIEQGRQSFSSGVLKSEQMQHSLCAWTLQSLVPSFESFWQFYTLYHQLFNVIK